MLRNLLKNKFVLAVGISLAFTLFINAIFLPAKATAEPDQFCEKAFANATTAPTFMTPGTATTTHTINLACTSNTYAMKEWALAVQFTASSTLSTLNISQEYSQDGIDWYQGTPTLVKDYATSTIPSIVDVNPVPLYSFKFASSTLGGSALSTTNNLATRLISFVSPTRYTRFVFSCQSTGANCSVWATVIGKKEIGER